MGKKREFYTVRGYQMQDKNNLLTSSMEDYLEMIYRVCNEKDYVRIKELASKLNVRPSSATKIVQKLKQVGLVNYQRYGIIQLTDKGEDIGLYLLERHKVVEKFLKNLGITESLLKDTEMIEHDISLDTLETISRFNDFLDSNSDIMNRYRKYLEQC